MKLWPTDPDPGPPSDKAAWIIFLILFVPALLAAIYFGSR